MFTSARTCRDCGTEFYKPQHVCPGCGSGDFLPGFAEHMAGTLLGGCLLFAVGVLILAGWLLIVF